MGVWIEIATLAPQMSTFSVTPLVGVWIEIHDKNDDGVSATVTPLVGVWIEIEHIELESACF